MWSIADRFFEALKSQPLALVLFAVNLAFLAAIMIAVERKDALLADLVTRCMK
jgi:hypothetical protein